MTDVENLDKVIKALECRLDINGSKYKYCLTCDYRHDIDHCQWACQTDGILEDALALLKAQEPRVMCAAEVAACPKGTVLWVEEAQGVVWNLFPLEIEISSTHPDTGTDYLFFITYHDVRKFECSEYNQTWRCWTQRPTDEQRQAVNWE